MAGVVDPASPEGMLRSYHGGDATGLSSVKNKPEDDRSIIEQVRNYLTTGINEDARYALGPNAAPAVTGLGSLLGELVGPGADVRDAVTASKETTQAVKEGDILGAGVGGLNTLASIAMMALPGSLGGAKKIGSELADSRVTERLFHGTPNPDIKKLKPSKEGVLGDGVYLTPDPKYASNYAEGDTGNVIPAFAKIQNPLRIKYSNNDPSSTTLIALGVPEEKAFKIVEKAFEEKGNITKEISSRAKKQGYDSIILENKDGGIQEIVSYRPDNIYPTTDSAENISKETQNFADRMLEKDIYPNDPEFYKLKKEFIEDVEKVSPERDKISVFPKPERMFPEGQRPKGGEYLNPKTGDVLTNKNVESASISITPEGKPKFDANPTEKENVGSPSTKGATQIKTNLFKKSAGWKWLNSPQEYKDIPTLVSVQNKGKHYYTLEANFPEGVNLTRYANSPSEPRLRPTVKGFVDLGKEIGKISVRGKEHPVYDKIINRYAGGSVVERNPYANYQPKAI